MLPILKDSISILQGELAEYIGVSRQTYCALEQGKRDISWHTFLFLHTMRKLKIFLKQTRDSLHVLMIYCSMAVYR